MEFAESYCVKNLCQMPRGKCFFLLSKHDTESAQMLQTPAKAFLCLIHKAPEIVSMQNPPSGCFLLPGNSLTGQSLPFPRSFGIRPESLRWKRCPNRFLTGNSPSLPHRLAVS